MLVLLAASTPAAAQAKRTAANWDAGAQHLVVKAGLMSEAAPGNFSGAAMMSPLAEKQALTALAGRLQAAGRESEAPTAPPATPAVSSTASITVTRFDALLVDQLGLAATAAHVQQSAVAAGLRPPSYFGTEVVARYLGLRYNHPSAEDALELYPWNAITRAEAAHSFAIVLHQAGCALDGPPETLTPLSLPPYTPTHPPAPPPPS